MLDRSYTFRIYAWRTWIYYRGWGGLCSYVGIDCYVLRMKIEGRFQRRSNDLVEYRIATEAALVFGSNFSRFILELHFSELVMSLQMVSWAGWYEPDQSAVGGIIGGDCTVVSMKFNRTPLLHTLLDFLQFWQFGNPSSHLRCLSLQVKHPVRTRFGLFEAAELKTRDEPTSSVPVV